MEQLLLEPVELTDAEIDAVAGGAATAAAGAGDNFAAALGATGVDLTIGSVHLTLANVALAIAA